MSDAVILRTLFLTRNSQILEIYPLGHEKAFERAEKIFRNQNSSLKDELQLEKDYYDHAKRSLKLQKHPIFTFSINYSAFPSNHPLVR